MLTIKPVESNWEKKFKTISVKQLPVYYTRFSLSILVAGVKKTLQDNNLKKTSVRLNKIIVIGYLTVAGDFCLAKGEFSDL